MCKDEVVQRLVSGHVNRANYMTKAQVAQKYCVSTRTVERWVARGWVRPMRYGHRLWFAKEVLERELAEAFLPSLETNHGRACVRRGDA